MIPRFSLYRDPHDWKDDIREDPDGMWVKWRDAAPYIEYSEKHGFAPVVPDPVVYALVHEQPMYGGIEELDLEPEPDEYALDLYDIMMHTTKPDKEDDS